ncbi:hypothetical protein H6P81_013191 [Aristolochia fimbriata]|uniref:SAP domain-containing protein n=1 Tax=Aristolochia fimbriata TaxID=158543 RepID=A0AAV7EIM0_ARIFI|nr:hypothetical protein H6P81_013191 [Aristolochia fimbriata]
MGNKKRDYFHNLSRKELQGLCKKHGLSAIGTTSHLIKLLFSYLKGESKSPPLCEERPSVATDISTTFHSSQLQLGPPETHLQVSCQVKEGSSKEFLQATRGKEPTNHLASQVLDKAPDIIASMENAFHSNTKKDEATGCSTSDGSHRDVNLTHAVPENQRERDYGMNNVSGPTHHQRLVVSQPDTPSPNQFTGYPAVSSQVSPKECTTDTKKPSTFQFYVSSEEGINLFVDLASSPSAWIKSLKDGVHICQSQQGCLLCNDPGGSDTSRNTFVCAGMQPSSRERKLDFLHTKSSLSSLTRDNPFPLTWQETFPVKRPDPSGQDNSVISSLNDLSGGRILQTVNAVLNECSCDLVATMDMGAMERCLSNPSRCPITTTEVAEAHSGSLSNVDSCAPGKVEGLGDFSSSNVGSFSSHNVPRQENSGSVSLEKQLVRNSNHDEEDDVLPEFVRPLAVTEAQSAEMQNQHLDEESCSLKEQQMSQIEYRRESCTKLDNPLSETRRRLHGSGSIEAFSNKRHRHGETHNSGHAGTAVRNLGTVTHLAREKLVPRRSKRLGSK